MGGITYLHDGQKTDYDGRHGLVSESTEQLLCRPNGSVWATADGRLMHLSGSKWENYSSKHRLSSEGLYTLFFDRDGNLWTADKGRVYELRRGEDKFAAVALPSGTVNQFVQLKDGTIWIVDAWKDVRPLHDDGRVEAVNHTKFLNLRDDKDIPKVINATWCELLHPSRRRLMRLISKWAAVIFLAGKDKPRGPAYANQQPVGAGNPNLIDSPFAVTQNAAGADDQVVHPRGDGIDARCADEDTEGVGLRHAPGAGPRLCQVHLAAPAGHDQIVGVAARARKAQPLPELDGCGQVVAWHNGEGSNGG